MDVKSVGLFFGKVLALAVVYEATSMGGKSHRVAWRGLQCACLVHASPWKVGRVPGIAAVLRPFKPFTRPMVMMSIATLFSGGEGPPTALQGLQSEESARIAHNVQTHAEGDLELRALEALKAELQQKNINLPPRIDDSELRYFLRSNAHYLPVVIKKLQDHLRWRQSQVFLTQTELQKWDHLVFWHGNDGDGRPCLVVRLGQAYQELARSEQATFVNVLISQTEHGARELVHAGTAVEDLTIIVDCFEMQLLSLPVSLMKAAAETLQRNYPRRLAHMYLLNVPGFLRIVAMAILSVCGPITRQKIRVLGDHFTPVVEQQIGGLQRLPRVLGGQCQCAKCDQVEAEVRAAAQATPRPQLRVQGREPIATPESVGMANWAEVPQATAAASPGESWRQILAIIGLIFVMLVPLVIKLITADWRSTQEVETEVVS
ncbi:SEC14 cytosolic factor family protein [Klebsormidium nitens]|uniref:SEC14 cytosolic factor family protein n=1 Tax=Klebsormidium nitens TaxID=105231 RepID=A0A1Y1HW13_KLENI|nr:SEC14 cytosolic factor family protein [Klebsormidium nitens]|eukprot:GAQ82834.1 SEC14 cytosolic factor family protein [Klebsormidium nitens]